MMSYWGEFASSGDPDRGRSGNQPEWKIWGSDPGQFFVFNTEADGGVRLSKATLTRTKVLAQIANDDRFEKTEERCESYADLVRFGRQLTRDEYETIEGGLYKDMGSE